MSTARATKAGQVPLRVVLVYITVLGLLLLFFALIAHFAKTRLALKFTGPQYFQICGQKEHMPYLYISVDDARTQMARIIQERKLSSEAAAQITQLIEKLSVPGSAHEVGIDHVNAMPLNLALDKLR